MKHNSSRLARRELGALVRWACAISLVCAATSSIAHAEEPTETERSRALFVDGSERVRKGDWVGARDRYKRSLALKRAAITLYSLAMAEERLGLLVEARGHYAAFVAEPEEPFTTQYRGHAYASLTALESRVAHLDVSVVPGGLDGQEIRLDGEAFGGLGGRRDVNPGTHTVEVTTPKYAPSSMVVQVKEGEVLRVALRLEPLTVETAAPPSSIAPTKTSPSLLTPAILIGGGSVLFVAGATLGIVGIVAAGDAPTNDGEEASAARAKLLVGDVLGGLGLVAAGFGVVLLLTLPSDETGPKGSVQLTPWIGPGEVGFSGTF